MRKKITEKNEKERETNQGKNAKNTRNTLLCIFIDRCNIVGSYIYFPSIPVNITILDLI